MLEIKDLIEKLKQYDEELEIKFELNYDKNFSKKIHLDLSGFTVADYLGEFDDEFIFNLYNEDLVEKVESEE